MIIRAFLRLYLKYCRDYKMQNKKENERLIFYRSRWPEFLLHLRSFCNKVKSFYRLKQVVHLLFQRQNLFPDFRNQFFFLFNFLY
jgi:hypothetical protein